MKILHIIPSYYPAIYWGGPVFCTYHLNMELIKLPNLSLEVLTTDAAGPLVTQRVPSTSKTVTQNYSVIYCKRVAGSSVSLEMLLRMIAKIWSSDIVHLSAIYSFPTIPTILLCRLFKKRLVWSIHGAPLDAHDWPLAKNRTLKRIWSYLCNFLLPLGGVVIIGNSERECILMKRLIPKAKSTCIPHGDSFDNSSLVKTFDISHCLKLMYMGRIDPKKGLENLLHSINLVKKFFPVRLDIYGDGNQSYRDSIKNLATSLGLIDKFVFFHGMVDGERKEEAFRNAHICVVPSHTESFCIVVVESLIRGVPVIASTGTPWKKIGERGCGLWVSNEAQAIATAIGAMANQAGLEDMSRNGINWMNADFNWATITANVYDVYRNGL